jgi:hypothetical protein
MSTKRRPSFDPKSFLAKVGEGRSIGKYRKDSVGVMLRLVVSFPPVVNLAQTTLNCCI